MKIKLNTPKKVTSGDGVDGGLNMVKNFSPKVGPKLKVSELRRRYDTFMMDSSALYSWKDEKGPRPNL